MRKLMFLLAIIAAESWPASVLVGAGRPYQTVKAAILAKLPLQDDLTIYVEMPTENYSTLETIVPDANWNGRQVTVRGLKWIPEITGYIDNDVVYEWAGDEVLPVSYNLKGPGGVDGNITASGSHQAFFKDHLGTTRMTVGDAGQILEASTFSAYGKEYWVVQPSGEMTREKFTGKEFDNEGAYGAESGVNLFYFGARYYDPDIGMWISTDPARQFSNSYAYSGNGTNPINFIDPTGLLLDDKAEVIYTENACQDIPFGGSMALANDFDEMRNDPNVTFSINWKDGGQGESFAANRIWIPRGNSFFESARIIRHEADHWYQFSYEDKLKQAGLLSITANWHDRAEDLKAEKGGFRGLLEWNSTLPRGKSADGVYYRWDGIIGRDRIIYNQAGWPN